MSKFLNTLIIGAASGAAAAYFFTTEKGKAVKVRIDEEIASFKEDPKAYQNQVVEKASDYKDLAVDTFQDYKTKFENGDITVDDLTKAVQEKTAQVADFAKESFELIKEKTAQVTSEQADVEAETKAIVDDIVIDIKIIMIVAMTAVTADHISAPYTVSITIYIDILIKLCKHISWRFYGLDFLNRRINVFDIHYYCATAEHSLSERQDKLFVDDPIKVKLVFLYAEKTLACYKLIFCEKISCK